MLICIIYSLVNSHTYWPLYIHPGTYMQFPIRYISLCRTSKYKFTWVTISWRILIPYPRSDRVYFDLNCQVTVSKREFV